MNTVEFFRGGFDIKLTIPTSHLETLINQTNSLNERKANSQTNGRVKAIYIMNRDPRSGKE
jgi:hypothetical protein